MEQCNAPSTVALASTSMTGALSASPPAAKWLKILGGAIPPSATAPIFTNRTGALSGSSPWRQVQALIKGLPVGVHRPFPAVFMRGRVAPAPQQPIIIAVTFDPREYEADTLSRATQSGNGDLPVRFRYPVGAASKRESMEFI